ncbi:MAG: BON domain-containing protein [Acidobacteriota bacterium]
MARRMTTWMGTLALAALCMACAQSDAGITTLVKTKLDADRAMTSNATIHVETTKHVVTLTGKAASDAEKKHAVQVARGTDGVQDVVDLLAVDPSVAPPAPAPESAAPANPAEPVRQ